MLRSIYRSKYISIPAGNSSLFFARLTIILQFRRLFYIQTKEILTDNSFICIEAQHIVSS